MFEGQSLGFLSTQTGAGAGGGIGFVLLHACASFGTCLLILLAGGYLQSSVPFNCVFWHSGFRGKKCGSPLGRGKLATLTNRLKVVP